MQSGLYALPQHCRAAETSDDEEHFRHKEQRRLARDRAKLNPIILGAVLSIRVPPSRTSAGSVCHASCTCRGPWAGCLHGKCPRAGLRQGSVGGLGGGGWPGRRGGAVERDGAAAAGSPRAL